MGEGSGINDGGENFCTAFGKRSLISNTTVNINTAIGHTNTAVGRWVLFQNITGNRITVAWVNIIQQVDIMLSIKTKPGRIILYLYILSDMVLQQPTYRIQRS